MVHFSHLRLPGERYAILYRFDKRGEGLPLHQHGHDTAHTIACTRGRVLIRVQTPNSREGLRAGYEPLPVLHLYDLAAGDRYVGAPQGPHEIVALEDGSSILNEFVSKPPESYLSLPAEALDGSADLGPLTYPLTGEDPCP